MGHRRDRNSNLLSPPQMPLLEQDMGHMMVQGIDHQPLNSPDLTVAGMCLIAAAHLDFTERHTVRDDRLGSMANTHRAGGDAADAHPADGHRHGEPVEGPRERIAGSVPQLASLARQETHLLGIVQPIELDDRAAQAYVLTAGLDERDGNQPSEAPVVVPRLNDEMSEGTSNGIDDHAGERPAGTVPA